jgi:hypothetical protein
MFLKGLEEKICVGFGMNMTVKYKLQFYQSAGKPWPFPWTISGAEESAIPQIVNVLWSSNFFPNLKSTS